MFKFTDNQICTLKCCGATDDDINLTAKYFDWIISSLPNDIPNDIIKRCVCIDGWVRGLNYWSYDFRTPPYIEYTAKTEQDMRIYLYKFISFSIAMHMEMKDRTEEETKWRYVRSHVQDGHCMYHENMSYTYNTIHDARKVHFEYHIYLLKSVLPDAEVEDIITEYEHKLNKWYTEKHWKYDRASFAFIEISNSKEIDSNGVEIPSPEYIL